MTSTQAKILATAVSALPGAVLVAAGFGQLAKASKNIKDAKGDLVPAAETVKQYAPEVYVATNMDDIQKSNLSAFKKLLLNTLYSKSIRKAFDGENAYYIPSPKSPIIISPKMVNKSIIGHEMGHHIEAGKRRFSVLDSILNSRSENRAWESSPFRSETDEDLRRNALETYKGSDKIMLGGLSAGIGAYLLPSLILKAFRK